MKANRTVCLSLVVVTVVTTTWFSAIPQSRKPDTVAKVAERVISASVEQASIEAPSQRPVLKSVIDPIVNIEIEQENPIQTDTFKSQTLSFDQAVEDLQSKFRLLETQYGVLSIDDIQVLEGSLNDIDDIDVLADFSSALDELLDAP